MMIRACLATLIAGSTLMAADQEWSIDVRGHVGASSPMTDIDGEDVDGKMSLAWGIDAGFHRPIGDGKLGLVLLGGVYRDIHRAEEGDLKLDYTAMGVNLAGGLSYKLMEPWHLEGLVHARLGTGDLDGHDENNTSVSGDRGTSTAFGLSVGGFYTFPFKLMVGGTVGYEFWQGESDVAGSTIDVEGDGLTFGVVAGYAF
jgi:hypothetical protein